jgi:3'(2'), 5'-bisphosphate nucleotidase
MKKCDKFPYSEYIPNLLKLARTTGDEVMHIYEKHIQNIETGSTALIRLKVDQSPLTLADVTAHRIIVHGLSDLIHGVSVVSEEDPNSLAHRGAKGKFWLVDPIDGTKEFLDGSGEFTINIALIQDGMPILGVVYAPALDQLYWGGSGIGAFRQCAGLVQALYVAASTAKDGVLRVVASKSHLNSETTTFIARLGATELVQAGSSLKFCRIAEGVADLYPRIAPTCEWDTGAAQAVVEGAGGVVIDMHGRRLRYGKQDVLNPEFIATTKWLAEVLI